MRSAGLATGDDVTVSLPARSVRVGRLCRPLSGAFLAILLTLSCDTTAAGDIRPLLERARVLPPLDDALRKAVEQDDSWRDGIVVTVLPGSGEEVPGDPGKRAFDLEGALRRAKPAPMSRPVGQGQDTSRAPGASLVGREIRGPEPGPAPVRPDAYRVLSVFVVEGEEFPFLCDATRIEPDELLTAGHCLYRHDPNGDGRRDDARWATRAYVWGAGSDPSTALPARRLAAHPRWIIRGAPDHDIGVVIVPALSAEHGTENSAPEP